MNDAARQTILAEQIAQWPLALAEAKKGNPWATLCLHCYGRHGPPHDKICPHDPPYRDRKSELLDRSAAALTSQKGAGYVES